MSDLVLYVVSDNICTLTLNRPDARNALSTELLAALDAALWRADGDLEARVIVLTGAGDVFCAGGDLGTMGDRQGDVAQTYGYLSNYVGYFHTMAALGKPTIAAVNGHALGGGTGIVMACDLAIATEAAKFGTPEVTVGIFPMMVMASLFRHVGRKAGMEMILTGERLTAARAAEIGLINRAVPADEFEGVVNDVAAKLTRWSPTVLRLGRRAFYASQDMEFKEALEYLKAMFSLNLLTEDAAEGLRAFNEKRKPKWSGE